MNQTTVAKRRTGPLLSLKTWYWLLLVGFALNAAYVMSWPFVLRYTCTLTSHPETVIDPQTGNTITAVGLSIHYHPWAATAYWPLMYVADETYVPLMSASLTWYEEVADTIALNWLDNYLSSPATAVAEPLSVQFD